MSSHAKLWGFLAAGFVAPVHYDASLLCAAAWCLILAFATWTPPMDGDE